MPTQVLIPITTTHSRKKFPTAKSVADYLGVPYTSIYGYTNQINGIETEFLLVCWHAGTVFPDGVNVFIHTRNNFL